MSYITCLVKINFPFASVMQVCTVYSYMHRRHMHLFGLHKQKFMITKHVYDPLSLLSIISSYIFTILQSCTPHKADFCSRLIIWEHHIHGRLNLLLWNKHFSKCIFRLFIPIKAYLCIHIRNSGCVFGVCDMYDKRTIVKCKFLFNNGFDYNCILKSFSILVSDYV